MPLAAGAKLVDMGDDRLRLMDEAGVDYAVLSLTSPGAEQFAIEVGKNGRAEDANNILAAVTKKHPDRFGGFASLAPKDAEWSVKELERCVKELGFRVGRPTPTSVIPTWTRRSTGRSWRRPRNSTSPSICTRRCP